MLKKLFNNKGFTLLELLVVIGIIAILVAVGTASYSTVQKKARDAKRKTDLKELQSAYEQYYSICDFKYPLPPDLSSSGIECSATTPPTTIMSPAPVDPLNTGIYTYTVPVIQADAYTLCAYLETENGNQPSTPGKYCLSQQQ